MCVGARVHTCVTRLPRRYLYLVDRMYGAQNVTSSCPNLSHFFCAESFSAFFSFRPPHVRRPGSRSLSNVPWPLAFCSISVGTFKCTYSLVHSDRAKQRRCRRHFYCRGLANAFSINVSFRLTNVARTYAYPRGAPRDWSKIHRQFVHATNHHQPADPLSRTTAGIERGARTRCALPFLRSSVPAVSFNHWRNC